MADAKGGLPRLIDRALEGDEVVISRHGRPVVELRCIVSPARAGAGATYDWLRSQRGARPRVGVSAVELLDELELPERD